MADTKQSVKNLNQDLDFLILSPVAKRQVLESLDPDFAKLNSLAKDQVVSSIPIAPSVLQGSSQRLAGYQKELRDFGAIAVDPITGLPPYSDEQRLKDQRLVDIATGRSSQESLQRESEGLNLSNISPIQSAIAGGVSVPSGISDLAINLMGQGTSPEGQILMQRQRGLQDMINQAIQSSVGANPGAAAVGSGITQALAMGGPGGAASSLARGAFREAGGELARSVPINVLTGEGIRRATGTPTTPSDIGVDILSSFVGGRGGVEPIATQIRSGTRRALTGISDTLRLSPVRAEATDVLTDLTKFPTSEISNIEKLQAGQYTELLPDLFQDFKKKGGAEGFIESGSNFLKRSGEEFAPAVQASVDIFSNTKTNLDNIIKESEDILSTGRFSVPDSKTRERLIRTVITPEIREINSENALTVLTRLNDDLTNFYKGKRQNLSTDQVYAKKALRDAVSNRVKFALDSQGVDPLVYSRYGAASELIDQIGENFLLAKNQLAGQRGKGAVKRIREGMQGTSVRPGSVVTAVSSAIEPVFGGDVRHINSQVNRLHDLITKTPPPRVTLPPEIRTPTVGQLPILSEQEALDRAIEQSILGEPF